MAVKVTGLAEINKALNTFLVDTEQAIADAVGKTAFEVQRSAVMDIRDPSPGKTIKKGNITHTQSKPGDAPNTDTGRLINSLSVNHQRGSDTAHVFTNLDYGFFLETVHNRPFLEPAKKKEIPHFDERVRDAVNKQIKAAKK